MFIAAPPADDITEPDLLIDMDSGKLLDVEEPAAPRPRVAPVVPEAPRVSISSSDSSDSGSDVDSDGDQVRNAAAVGGKLASARPLPPVPVPPHAVPQIPGIGTFGVLWTCTTLGSLAFNLPCWNSSTTWGWLLCAGVALAVVVLVVWRFPPRPGKPKKYNQPAVPSPRSAFGARFD